MNLDFLLAGKLFLVFYIWLLIAFCIFFILQSKVIYQRLKSYELFWISKRKEAVHNFIPMMLSISKYNKDFQIVLGTRKVSLKDLLFLTAPFTFNALNLFQWARSSLNLIRRILNPR